MLLFPLLALILGVAKFSLLFACFAGLQFLSSVWVKTSLQTILIPNDRFFPVECWKMFNNQLSEVEEKPDLEHWPISVVKHSHYGWFQTTSTMRLKWGLERDAQSWLSLLTAALLEWVLSLIYWIMVVGMVHGESNFILMNPGCFRKPLLPPPPTLEEISGRSHSLSGYFVILKYPLNVLFT